MKVFGKSKRDCSIEWAAWVNEWVLLNSKSDRKRGRGRWLNRVETSNWRHCFLSLVKLTISLPHYIQSPHQFKHNPKQVKHQLFGWLIIILFRQTLDIITSKWTSPTNIYQIIRWRCDTGNKITGNTLSNHRKGKGPPIDCADYDLVGIIKW